MLSIDTKWEDYLKRDMIKTFSDPIVKLLKVLNLQLVTFKPSFRTDTALSRNNIEMVANFLSVLTEIKQKKPDVELFVTLMGSLATIPSQEVTTLLRGLIDLEAKCTYKGILYAPREISSLRALIFKDILDASRMEADVLITTTNQICKEISEYFVGGHQAIGAEATIIPQVCLSSANEDEFGALFSSGAITQEALEYLKEQLPAEEIPIFLAWSAARSPIERAMQEEIPAGGDCSDKRVRERMYGRPDAPSFFNRSFEYSTDHTHFDFSQYNI